MSERIYPRSRLARALVWCLDRMPAIRRQVLGSYWSPEEVRAAREETRRIRRALGLDKEDPS